ncbi:MAG TPA: MraY family glycosyltransferase [Rhodocyclaceae bacterium]|nr:MraY family glycosyltransferase [Rhodocyclaceae bacterium]
MTPKYLLFPFVCTLLACVLLARLAPMLSLLDRPDARKQHGRSVPVVGGIAIMLSYLLALKLRGLGGNLVEAILPVGLMLTVGIIDDIHPLSARLKLVAQLVAAWLLIKTTGFSFAAIPLPGSTTGLPLGFLAVPATMLVFVAITNAINMADGADGLAGGYVLIALLFFAVVALLTGRAVSLLLIVGLISAVLGFLVCNARHPWLDRALIFMGDAGALSLGVLLCWLGIDLARGPAPVMPPILIFFALALPLLDMVTVATRRMLRGVSPMRADRTHLHHLLCLQGWSVELSVPLLWLLHAASAGVGLLLWRVGASDGVLAVVFCAMLIAKLLWLRVWDITEMSAEVNTKVSTDGSSDA